MSEDLSKLNRMRRILLDEDPTDCSPLLALREHEQLPTPVSADAQITQAKLTRFASPDAPETSSKQMLQRQKDEIAELRKAIQVMSSEIDLLHNALNDKCVAETEVGERTITGQHAPTPVNRILLMLNGQQVLKFPLHRSSMTVGRSADNDIQIATDYVSRVHARISSDANGAIIEDLNSRNGVVINSVKVSRQKLCNGDMIALGKTQFKFIDLMEDSAGEGRA